MPKSAITAGANADSSVEVARISARQAIIVAIVTSLAGVLGGIIGYYANKPAHLTPGTLHAISIDGVRSEPNCQCAIRVVAVVNGQAYSYPSRAVWADIGPGMSKEEFPLAPADVYRVNFQAYLRRPDGDTVKLFTSNYNKESPPGVDLEFELSPMDQEFSRGAEFVLSIKYHVR
jgi:hypothetical protein